jgi:hypothetical protein
MTLLPSEWVHWGESFPERLSGEALMGVVPVGNVARLFDAEYPSPL